MKPSLFATFLFAVLTPLFSHAQIYNCDGVVTNKPCGSTAPVMEEKPYQEPDPKALAEARRSLWLENLDLARARVSREFGISVDITPTRDQCMTSSIDDCRRAISEKEKDINQLIIAAAKNRGEEKTVVPPEKNQPNQTVVTIINDRDDDLILNRRRPWTPGRHRPHHPSSPQHPYPPGRPHSNHQDRSAPPPVLNPESGQIYNPGVRRGAADSSRPELAPPLRR